MKRKLSKLGCEAGEKGYPQSVPVAAFSPQRDLARVHEVTEVAGQVVEYYKSLGLGFLNTNEVRSRRIVFKDTSLKPKFTPKPGAKVKALINEDNFAEAVWLVSA